MRFVSSCVVLLVLANWMSAEETSDSPGGAILFSSIGPRGWDIYVFDSALKETHQLTDHPALDYNAAFGPDGQRIAFVSERDGNPELYVVGRDGEGLRRLTHSFALDDHPTWSPDGQRIAFSSTRQPSMNVGQSWNAIYVMNADGTHVQRVSPQEVADYSPAWSPNGEWLACASGSGDPGQSDLYLMKPDGSERRRVIANGGWPAFSADSQWIYFHRKSAETSEWAVWRVKLDGSSLERIVADETDVITPSVSASQNHLVTAIVRGGRRQIVQVDLATQTQTQLTNREVDHWNPSISMDGHVAYHCSTPDFRASNVELWGAPSGHRFQMIRLSGAFPAVSPDGRRVALTGGNFARFDVMNIDGSERRTVFESQPRHVFSLSWSPANGNSGERIAFSHGKSFQGADSIVNVETVAPDGSAHESLTADEGNNAFPSFSPDGGQLVFRSGRDGDKNLYLMNSDGTNVRRLTHGNWTDTMADWSPTGEWIAFSSDRGGNFEIWLIRPDGTGLKKLIGGNVRHNHPHFSPDGEWIVFTSQRAGLSAEVISLPRQPQPYGDLFAVRLDGSGLVRLTHNGFEEGTPDWSSTTNVQPSRDHKPAGQHEY